MKGQEEIAAELDRCETILKGMYREVIPASNDKHLFFYVRYPTDEDILGSSYSFAIAHICEQLGGEKGGGVEPREGTATICIPSSGGGRPYWVHITLGDVQL
jgi:hypothetical protein